ncbi:MAG: hypothetical protein PHV30_03945 [Candidatus Margulisbacteria bacterium]|nr:hypothetical protein [Candidatus Margulisiibacteriota bacterium]
MKKIILFIFCAGLLQVGFANFSLTITQNPVVNFGSLNPNEGEWVTFGSSYPNTVVQFEVNSGAPWSLDIKADPFNGPAAMGVENMQWDLVYAQEGSTSITSAIPNANQKKTFTTTGETVYSKTPVSNVTNLFNFIWFLRIPVNQTAGNYYSTIVFTLTQ